MTPAQLTKFYEKYGQIRVDEALTLLNYRNVTPLPKVSAEVEESGRPILYVFRHGQTTDNEQFIFSGWRDPELTELGKEQALALAPKLAAKKLGLLYVSDQKRSTETLKLALTLNTEAGSLPVVKDPRIKERSYGDLTGHSKLIVQLENPELLKLERRSYAFVPPNGESIEMVVERVTNFIEELLEVMREKQVNAAVSCHGNSARGFRKYFEQLTADETAAIETPLGQDFASYAI